MTNINQKKVIDKKRATPYQKEKKSGLSTFFYIQFLGALNDNIFKNTLVLLISFYGIQLWGMNANILVSFAFALFILPFFLFSAIAGQLADKYSKDMLIKRLKIIELFIMIIAVIGFYWQSYEMLIIVLFLMGTQSAFFGPVKYSILPDLVSSNRGEKISQCELFASKLLSANGLIEMGTFLAILSGTILAGVLVTNDFFIQIALPLSLIGVSTLGVLFSFRLPKVIAKDTKLKVNYSIFSESIFLIKDTKLNRPIYHVILLISLFWFLGACVLSQIPVWGKELLGQDQIFVSFMLVYFSVGIGIGSIFCRFLSRWFKFNQLTTMSAILLSLSLLLFVYASLQLSMSNNNSTFTYIINISLFLQGFFAGIYIVPLYTFIQQRSDSKKLARTIAVTNILNALFMVTASVLLMLLVALHLKLTTIFIALSALFICVFIYIRQKDKRLSKYQSIFN